MFKNILLNYNCFNNSYGKNQILSTFKLGPTATFIHCGFVLCIIIKI